jgi:hypothetical protein
MGKRYVFFSVNEKGGKQLPLLGFALVFLHYLFFFVGAGPGRGQKEN